jgi:hypothetical protein
MVIGRSILLALTVGFIVPPTFGATPAGSDVLQITTGAPKKKGESIFSLTVQWRMDESMRYESSGLALAHGPNMPHPDTAETLAHKLPVALRDAMEYQYENWRGVTMEQVMAGETPQPQVLVRNNEGFNLTAVTLRDYTNEKMKLSTPKPSFAADEARIAFDIMEAYKVDVPEEFRFLKEEPGEFRATGGTVTLTVGESAPAIVETKDKTPAEIEAMLAEKLASHNAGTSDESIVPNTIDANARNNPPFDKGELQLPSLQSNSVTIDVNDPSIGVISKIAYPDPGGKAASGTAAFIFQIISLIGVGVILYVLYNFVMAKIKPKT